MFAVFVETSILIPGDERSQTNPGHGYPEHRQTYTTLIKFDTGEKLSEWILRNQRSSRFEVFRIEPITWEIAQQVVIK
jgi:antibiotic biosynthesis monooxygenase (ABM) superfamily enzyme